MIPDAVKLAQDTLVTLALLPKILPIVALDTFAEDIKTLSNV